MNNDSESKNSPSNSPHSSPSSAENNAPVPVNSPSNDVVAVMSPSPQNTEAPTNSPTPQSPTHNDENLAAVTTDVGKEEDVLQQFMEHIDDPTFSSQILLQQFATLDKKTQKDIILRADQPNASVPQGLKTRMIKEYKGQPGGCLPTELASKPLDVLAYATTVKTTTQ